MLVSVTFPSSAGLAYRTDRTPYMRAIMDALSPAQPARRVVFMKAAQVGAPLAIQTPVPTAMGWKAMGELGVGDWLFDEKGGLCAVSGLSEVMTGRPCYEVVFDDGETIVCDRSHRWAIWDFTNPERPVAKVLCTTDMLFRVRMGAKRYRYAIDCCHPVEMPARAAPGGSDRHEGRVWRAAKPSEDLAHDDQPLLP